MVRVNSPADLTRFFCGDEDLDDFFTHDAYYMQNNCLVKPIFLQRKKKVLKL